MKVSITSNADKVAADIRAMMMRARNPAPPMKVGAALLNTLIDDSFRASASPAGEQWPALAPSTLKNRARSKSGKGGKRRSRSVAGAKPLLDTGVGRNSIRVRANGSTITIGVGARYMAYHLAGDRKRIPPRPPRRAWAPVLSDGTRWTFDSRGMGGKWLTDLRMRVIAYIREGR